MKEKRRMYVWNENKQRSKKNETMINRYNGNYENGMKERRKREEVMLEKKKNRVRKDK